MKLYQIYEAYQSDLLKYAYSLSRQWEDAEDLVQQAYLKALEQHELFEQMHEMQIRGWLYVTIKRLFIDAYRKGQRMILQDESFEVPYDAYIESDLVTSDLLARLPETCRTIVYLKYVQGYNSSEIGTRLGLNASTVRSRLSQATRLMRTWLL